jgi:hypothetical protein
LPLSLYSLRQQFFARHVRRRKVAAGPGQASVEPVYQIAFQTGIASPFTKRCDVAHCKNYLREVRVVLLERLEGFSFALIAVGVTTTITTNASAMSAHSDAHQHANQHHCEGHQQK